MPTSTARASPTTSLSPSPGPGRSLLSRIKSPFGSKARYISEFYIKPDDPHRQYSPGDIITGAVILRVVKPIRVTHIVVSLHGYVQVYKNPNSPGDGYRSHYSAIATGKGSRIGGYFGNGFASLFEDEVVLCGEGRLGEGTYQFNFELEFPSKGLPSSIDFERGTISYMLTSTMTRPTTIMPTATCDRKIYLIESIDIAPLIRPKPRIVTLERVSRRSRAKSKVKKGTNTGSGSNGERSNGEGSSGDQSNGQAATEASRSSRVSELSEVDTPGSPAPSDTSFESHFSSSQGGSSNASGALSARGTENGKQGSTKAVFVDKKPITATIELLKAGFLRGDNIPLKICVSHTKHVQNLRGIIVTLYRQARVDMHPAIPVVMNAKGEKVSSEDYYPKSKTGLGGLSLSSAGSSHVFRKDLAQSFAPLIVDPRTRTAEVKASVCVPDDAFPSITSVPGAMISFKYYVEIVVDLQGKLTGLDKYFSNSGMMLASAPQLGKAEDTNSGVFSAWGGHFLDTEQLRRDKGVVSCVFEVIVGTRDSDRRKGKRRATSENDLDHSFSVSGDSNGLTEEQSQLTGYASQQTGFPLQSERHNYYYGQPLYDDGYGEEVPHPYAHPTYPVSDLTNEDALPEKERLRRAEARLMPSQPPVEGGSSAADAIHAPSAPVIPEERPDILYPTASLADAAGPSAPPLDALGPPPSPSVSEETAAPTYEERQGESSHVSRAAATDDKHDLARRRLEMDRSAPGEIANEDAAGGGRSAPSAPPVDTLAPSAPVLTDEEYVFPSTHPTDLPRYER
ncbi:ph-response sensor protein [Diplodia intermedia]|uniref:Ph-response sensor protein n=1 Tax=Diplodia intermedia TaxID=856260 RepID=A0ABR3T9V3_9PEZI